MGLRINTNISSVTALRTLKINERNQSRSLERLSTGLRINRASDDPSGLVISEILRGQLRGLNQAVENSQNANNLMAVADSALANVADLLVGINESIIFALNTGGTSPDQISAEQDAVDNAISAIERVAATTRYGDLSLLNGTADFHVTSDRPNEIQNFKVRSLRFADAQLSRTISFTITQTPQRAEIVVADVSAAAGATIRITGPRGTTDVFLGSGAVASSMARAINTVADVTGVYASAGTGAAADIRLNSEGFGTDESLRLEIITGSLSGTATITTDTGTSVEAGPFTTGEVLFDRGREGIVTVDGRPYTGKGTDFSILATGINVEFQLNEDLIGSTIIAGAAFSLTIANTGLGFQLTDVPRSSENLPVGIESMSSASLGIARMRDKIDEAGSNTLSPNLVTTSIYHGGYLNTIQTGGGNDLFQDPKNALNISRAALEQVSNLRAFLGATRAYTVEPNIDTLGVSIENLTSALSDLRDLDFAEETANFVRSQILFQSGVGVLSSANAVPQSVLQLLGVGA